MFDAGISDTGISDAGIFDAVIIGGGLAGCNAAIYLAQRGHHVALLEAGHYPRAKVCGEFLSPECQALAREAGFLDALCALNPVAIHTLGITAHSGHTWRTQLPTPAWGLSRFALDQTLAEYAQSVGVSVFTNCPVRQIEGDLQQGFSLTTSTQTQSAVHARLCARTRARTRARTVIGACGRQSKLNAAHEKSMDADRYIGLKQHFNGPSLSNHLDLHVFQGGYCGMSQVEDGSTNVCLMVQQSLFQRITGQGKVGGIRQFIQWLRQQSASLDQWLAQATPVYAEWLSVANVSLASKAIVQRDVLYAGDAAGMIAPLAGDGMAMALHSGQLAAQAIHQYLTGMQTAPAMLRTYANNWQRTFGQRLKLGRWLQSLMLYPRLLAPALAFINHFPPVGQWLIRHTRDLKLLKQTT